MELESILQLIQSVSNSSLSSFTLEEGNLRLSLTRGPIIRTDAEAPVSEPVSREQIAENVQSREVPEISEAVPEGKVITSLLVGTFYTASGPEEEPYVRIGDTVKKGQVLGIVEAMKLMNEIESDYEGVVKEVYAEDGQMVEYGQPLFLIG